MKKLLLVPLVLLVFTGSAEAYREHLTATPQHQVFITSKLYKHGGHVWVRVWSRGHRLLSGEDTRCGAIWADRWVTVRVERCGRGRQPLRITYFTRRGETGVTVRHSRNASLPH